MVGVVHDTDGYPVAAATVTLHTAAGGAAGAGSTAADGTFAIDANADAASAEVRCTYCLTMTVNRVPGQPVVAVVRRFAALRDRGISAADARALPYSAVTDLASLMPFVVASQGAISDRGLAGAHGAVIPDGVALYRGTDGTDLGTAIPAHGTATIAETAPTQANVYDSYSAGGLFSIDTLDQAAGLARVDGGTAVDTALRGGNVLRGAFETAGGTDAASRALLDGALPAAGGSLDLRAVAASGLGTNATGFATTLVAPVRTSSFTAAISMVRSVNTNGPENDNIAALSLQSGHLTYGLRGERTSGFVLDGTGVQYDERAFVQGAWDAGAVHLFASLAVAQDGETLAHRASTKGAVLPIFSVSAPLAGGFSVHADSVAALLSAPLYLIYTVPNGTAISQSQLLDAGVGYDNGSRLRIDAMVFRQTVASAAYGTTGGSGISTVWQIAPSVALRSWVLFSSTNGNSTNLYNAPYTYSSVYASATPELDRNVTWLTVGNVLRVDALWRNGNLEGGFSFPFGAQFRFNAGTIRDGSNRVYTAGLSWH